ATVSGLSTLQSGELVKFASGIYGLALNLEETQVGIAIMGDASKVRAGEQVERTGRVMSVPASEGMLGRVISPLGAPVDGKGPIKSDKEMLVEKVAPGV